MNKKITFLLLFFATTLSSIQAQGEVGIIGINFQVGLPQDAFKDAYNVVGFGGSMDLYFKINEDMPIYAGVNLSIMRFEQFERDFRVRLPGGFDRYYRLRASTNLFSGYGGLRIMPNIKTKIRPYAEGLLGFKNFYISKRLEERQDQTDGSWEEIDRDTDGDWTLGYGGSAGILIFFKNPDVALDLKCSYLAGKKVTFFKLKEIEDIDEVEFEVNPFSAFDPVKAVTTMLIPQIGLVFQF